MKWSLKKIKLPEITLAGVLWFIVAVVLIYFGYNVASGFNNFFKVPSKKEVDEKSNGSRDITKSGLTAWELIKLYFQSFIPRNRD